MSVSDRVKELLSQHRPNDHLVEIMAMTLAREIDRLRDETVVRTKVLENETTQLREAVTEHSHPVEYE